MRLEKIRIENFRSFKDETIEFDNYTCLVGPNGCGKSTILMALNVFFRNNASTATNVLLLGKEDFHHCDTSAPVKITLTFNDLSDEAKDDLKHYVRQERLVVFVRARWNEDAKCAEPLQYGSRLVMRDFAEYFEALDKRKLAPEMKVIYEKLCELHPDLDRKAKTADTRLTALRTYEESHPELCELLDDTAQFFGFTKGANLLGKYIKWVYVPAVKDASTEQDESNKTALGQLLEITIRSKVSFKEPIAAMKAELEAKYKELVDKEEAVLTDLSTNIERRLREWTNPSTRLKLGWHYDPNKAVSVSEPSARASIGEGSFIGEVARLGHGVQRAFLVSMLHELATTGNVGGPTLLLGFEEPELYQHPPQAQHMSTVLENLADDCNNSQVIISTHSPYFVSTKGFESVRMVKKHTKTHHSFVASTTYKKVSDAIQAAKLKPPQNPTIIMMKLDQVMQPSQRELYFTKVAVMVEGVEDVAYIATHLHVTARWSDFRKHGCHFIVSNGKQSLSRPLAIARELGIPSYVVFDGDTNKTCDFKGDNALLMRLCGHSTFDDAPTKNVIAENYAVWPKALADVVKTDVSTVEWNASESHVCTTNGFHPNEKGHLMIAGTVEHLAGRGILSKTLTSLCDGILKFAENAHK